MKKLPKSQITYSHIKTGKIYIVYEADVPDATNGREDKPMVIYYNLDGNFFVRDEDEFFTKFIPVKSEDVIQTPFPVKKSDS
ncbi:unnamed protein product [marine sediment metagenome]|uniref:DUF1653 domain-containing protein n=1 Tax=marine sediment metagenome TaxID=412755 RepID=X1TES2_9ZZZZ